MRAAAKPPRTTDKRTDRDYIDASLPSRLCTVIIFIRHTGASGILLRIGYLSREPPTDRIDLLKCLLRIMKYYYYCYRRVSVLRKH